MGYGDFTTNDQLAAIYVGYFGRAADPSGLAYWNSDYTTINAANLAAGQSAEEAELNALIEIATSFSNDTEAMGIYTFLADPATGDASAFVDAIYNNLFNRAPDDAGKAYWMNELEANIDDELYVGKFILAVMNGAATDSADLNTLSNRADISAYYAEQITEWTREDDLADAQSIISSVTDDDTTVTDAKAIVDAWVSPESFSLTVESAAGADVMHLTGDMDVRIDLTANDNQVTGLDLDGDGVIAQDGVENNNPTTLDDGVDFEIIDAYARNPLNHGDIRNNFLGDIAFDGTGFSGDGVNTDGNIFLGGLGVDRATGGIGNDFMAGGGVAADRFQNQIINGNVVLVDTKTGAAAGTTEDYLFGGRNADFFFTNLSALDIADGDALDIDGGETADDNFAGMGDSAQDTDWLLIEASDDDEPVFIRLAESNVMGSITTAFMEDQGGKIDTGDANDAIDIINLENVDASGNLYGFLDDLDVALGEAGLVTVDGENVGIGSSAQLQIFGNSTTNRLIGGYDNDYIEGGGGDDLLMGGNLAYNNNPNLQNIVNDGMDALYGGTGDDDIVFEADGGIIDGENGNDTLWLTNQSLGTQTVADMTDDSVLRFDLLAENIDDAAGYGGADIGGTQDQTNYADSDSRVTVTNMENVIATGLGAIDFLAAGTNDPDLIFNNQQNFFAYDGDLDLRGSDDANILYANTGDDIIEGREGNDKLSGGEGNDDFIFALGYDGEEQVSQDGIDVIHRQVDADNDNLWDTDVDDNLMYGRDFGLDSTAVASDSTFTLGLPETLAPYVDGINFELAGTVYNIVGLTADDLTTWMSNLDAALAATAGLETVSSDSPAEGIVVLTDAAGGTFVELAEGWILTGGTLPSDGLDQWYQEVGAPVIEETQDRLIYVAYEDRNDGELSDDDSVLGSNVSLGIEGYAEDLVVNFAADGTRIAEDQSYAITFDNLTTQDIVTITVNDVTYQLQVGVDLDGNIIEAEDGPSDSQADIQDNFLDRLTNFIDDFMDDDTAAGQVDAALNGSTITLTQVNYNGEETVFMSTPTVEIQNLSAGETPTVSVLNNSQHEVHLLDFDGRDGELNSENVLFLGNTGINRATLETAETAGSDIVGKDAVLIDNLSNDYAATVANTGDVIADSQATNAELDAATEIYSVHGDDLLLGGAGEDDIQGGTGDDRVIGSLGDDTLDGGKNFYEVQVLGEAQTRVYELNNWESENPSEVAALDGLTISYIELIPQAETGVTLADGRFDDTLQFQQADFETGVTEFTITLDDYNMNGTVLELQNDGAGTVEVDVDGDGVFESISTFTNFENIRTVSGIGKAVADDGQGNDTLDVQEMSTDTGGIYYNLTDDGYAGEVWYSTDDILTDPIDGDFPDEDDYDAYVIRVDGVENVIGGTGHDMLQIDETEAAKDNLFDAGLGVDRIEYLHSYDWSEVAEPTVTIKVNTASETDEVVMTGGRVGSTVATDTLIDVEYLRLGMKTAESVRADDVIDVTAMTNGAVVDYTNGEIRDLDGDVQLTIQNIHEMENVWADGDDTVIVADNNIMRGNAQYVDGRPNVDIPVATFMDYDELDPDTNLRVAFADQDTDQIQNVKNVNLFTFDLSHTGDGNDSDTVDYSQAVDSIATTVMVGNDQYMMVDGDNSPDSTFHNYTVSRVDHLMGVERIIASQAESVLDFTALGEDVEITFQFDEDNAVVALDRMESVVRVGNAVGNTIEGIPNYVEYWDLDADPDVDAFNNAAWTRIEGGDFAEAVFYDGSEDLTNLAGVDHRYTDDVLNLRGGENNVSYFALETSINASIEVTEFDADNALGTGLIETDIEFEDGTGTDTLLLNSGTHEITSYTSDNGIAAGTLKLEASQDAEDSLTFTGFTDKVYFPGTSSGVIEVKIGALDTMRLTGFEILKDGETNDVYDMKSLANVDGNLELVDGLQGFAGDHDTIKVYDDAAANAYNGGTGNTVINLEELNTVFNFDFDVLDVTGVTSNNVISLIGTTGAGPTDEVVLGAIRNIDTISEFEGVVFTDATVAENGTTFALDVDTDVLSAGTRDIDVSLNTGGFDMATVSFRGLVLEAGTIDGGQVANVTDGITFTVEGAATTAISVYGGDGDDVITGAGGNDTFVGGLGADIMDGGFTPAVGEVQTVTFDASTLLAGDDVVRIGFGSTVGTTDVVLETSVATNPLATEITLAAATADEDAVGTAFAGYSDASWETALGLIAGDISSVDYDSVGNVLTFNFAVQAGDVATLVFDEDNGSDSTANLTGAITLDTDGVDAAAEVFTLTLNAALAAVGADTIVFDGYQTTLVGGENNLAAAAAIAAGSYTNWTALDLGTGAVTFTADTAEARTDVLTGNFIFTDVGLPSANLNGVVAAPTTQGTPGAAEVFTLNLHNSLEVDGPDTITFDGTTTTLTTGDGQSAVGDDVAASIFANWTATDDGAGNVTFTADTAEARTNTVIGDFTFTNVVDDENTVDGTVVDNATAYSAQVDSADTYVFEASALANGLDTINNFDDSDTLDFSAFAPDAVNEVDNNGTPLTAASIAAHGNDVNEVVIEWDSTVAGEDANVWFMSDLNNNGSISADEVSMVGVITEAGDLEASIY